MSIDEINELVEAWQSAKAEEAQARDRRRELQERLVKVIGNNELEGSRTVTTPVWKVRVTNRLDRKVDAQAYDQEVVPRLEAHGLTFDDMPITYKYVVDVRRLRQMAGRAEVMALLELAVESKPASPTVTVEAV